MQILHLSMSTERRQTFAIKMQSPGGTLPKSVPLYFGLDKTLALYFYHQYYYSSQ